MALESASMNTLSFDTLKYAKQMQQAGMDQQLAEALADALKEQHSQAVSREHLATALGASAAAIKTDIIKWVAGMLVAQAAVVATLVKLLQV